MRNLILSALLLASVFQTAVGQIVEGQIVWLQWTYIVENGGATITASTATGAVTIPSELGGYAVKKVGNGSFPPIFGYPSTSVTSVAIPNSVTSIGDSAFWGCSGLTSITIGSGVTSIGGSAFVNCTGLTGTLTIPNRVTSIGPWAFYYCTGLTNVTIPDSVMSIGDLAFSGVTGSINVVSGNPNYSSDEAGVLFNKAQTTLITCPRGRTGLFIIPNSVTTIGNFAFFICTGLTGITIPNSVTSIGSTAFSYCTGLTGITIPNSVTSIGPFAFQACTGLTGITIPNSVTSIGSAAFSYCTGLTGITIPNSVTSIESGAFYGCTGLTGTLTIPNSVTSIGPGAFRDCTGLTSVTFTATSSVTSIGEGAFYGCTGLTNVTIPDSVMSIGPATFRDCTGLTSVTFTATSSVTSIGEDAFYGCTRLVTVYLPDRFADTYINFGLTASQANFGITLTASCNSSQGTILANPNKHYYQAGESVVVTATPNAGYLFSNWTGASTATTSSISLTMDAPKILTVTFTQDGRDSDGDSLTNYQESVTYGTNPNLKDSNADGVEDGHAVSMGYNPTQNFSALVAHPPTGLYTANQMQAMAIGDLVLTKNVGGTFTLNYDIEQSADLQTWTTYAPLSLPLTGLPTDKAFVRIKAKQ